MSKAGALSTLHPDSKGKLNQMILTLKLYCAFILKIHIELYYLNNVCLEGNTCYQKEILLTYILFKLEISFINGYI